jgi:eukaryotic-like serine/threonine-protein kinase
MQPAKARQRPRTRLRTLARFLLIEGLEVALRDPVVGEALDQYQLTELLARSGMASIFKAVDRQTGGAVAIKIPHVQYESDVVFFERFRREEEIGQRLDHPNIVRVFAPREKSRMYMAMELVEGKPLSSILREQGPLPVERALEIARQVCDALACLHAHGVVHRDIKPENVHVTASGQVKVLDFGIALLESARRLTWAGLSHAVGTPDYMAPEQLRGRRGDARTDVYGVGMMLYEMLTGHLPSESASSDTRVRAFVAHGPTPPGVHVPGVDPALEAVIMKAIEPDPRDRYALAADLLADLLDPAAARTREPLARRPSRRRPAPRRFVASIALAAALAGLGALVWLSAARPAPTAPARVVK